MGFAENETRVRLIEKHISDLQKIHYDLEKICNGGATVLSEMQNNDIFFYQFQTAKYGSDLMQFNIEWYSRLLKNIKE